MQAAAPVAVFPRIALVVAGVVIALALGSVGIARWSGFDGRQQDAQTVAQRALYFKDQPDGGIAIVDAKSGATIDTAHGEQGFLRGTLRAVVRERKLRGLVSTHRPRIFRSDQRRGVRALVDPHCQGVTP
jgi:putative photosynthetic complex assembly protein